MLGNVFSDRALAARYRRRKAAGACESLHLTRAEMERVRLRRRTDKGTDVALVMERGGSLRHGDVLYETGAKLVVVMQLPEKVVSVRIKEKDRGRLAEASALVGHAIGNRHRPISVSNGTISFPVMAESEIETFQKLLPNGNNIELGIEEKIFLPSGGGERMEEWEAHDSHHHHHHH